MWYKFVVLLIKLIIMMLDVRNVVKFIFIVVFGFVLLFEVIKLINKFVSIFVISVLINIGILNKKDKVIFGKIVWFMVLFIKERLCKIIMLFIVLYIILIKIDVINVWFKNW